MTDRELLELAAKAAGMWVNDFSLDDDYQPFFHDERGFRLAWGKGWWNPITDDGDALRLVVKLTVDIVYDFDRVMVVFGNRDASCITEYFYDLPQPTDRYAATRRAIVRAAAEIGKAS